MSKIDNAGVSDITFQLGNTTFTHKFVVSKSLSKEILLGIDFVYGNQIKLLYHDDHSPYLEFGEGDCIDLMEKYPVDFVVKATENTKLPPYYFTVVKCCISQHAKTVYQADDILHITPTAKYSNKMDAPLLQDSTVSYRANGKVFLIMANHTPAYHTIKKNTIIGTGSSVKQNNIDITETCQVMLDGPPVAPVNYWSPDLAGLDFNQPLLETDEVELAALSDVPPEFAKPLQEIIDEYKSISAADNSHIGLTHLIKIDIDTGDHPPISMRPYKTSLTHCKWLEEEIDKLLRGGIIIPSHSPWSFPIVIVKKKDGGFRLTIDYRKLNEISTSYSYQMPCIDSIFGQLANAKYLTSIDVRGAYHHIALSESAAPKTAFLTDLGKFMFLRVPFGLTNAPAYFQELMNMILHGCESFALAYLDDVLIFSCTPEEHLEHIKIVLQRLKDAGLTLKQSKCCFFRTHLNYLGHVITRDGLKPDPQKTKAIEEMAAPTNVKGIRRFLGLTGFYRRFVPGYSEIAKPLAKLIRKNCQFQWNTECERVFQKLKACLTSAPILAYPDLTKPYILYTDASDTCIGSVLMQQHEHNGELIEKPVFYYSVQLHDAQIRWSPVVKEAYAIYKLVLKLKSYIENCEVLVKSDHKPLKKYFTDSIQNTKIDRWSLTLQEFNLKFMWIAGAANKAADFMSRLYAHIILLMDQIPCHDSIHDSHDLVAIISIHCDNTYLLQYI